MNNNIRFELSFKNISQLENKLNFCKLNNIKNINIPCKGVIKRELFNDAINYISKNFSLIQENQEIQIRVIGQRYELNDKYIIFNPLKSESEIKKQYPGIKKAKFLNSYSSDCVKKISKVQLKETIKQIDLI